MAFINETTPSSGYQTSKHPYKTSKMEDLSLYTEQRGIESDRAVIKQSLANILLTMKGERLFNISFGTNLYKYIFENENNISGIKTEIYDSIMAYESRIYLDTRNINIDINADEHYIDIKIEYTIKETSMWDTWYDRLYL